MVPRFQQVAKNTDFPILILPGFGAIPVLISNTTNRYLCYGT